MRFAPSHIPFNTIPPSPQAPMLLCLHASTPPRLRASMLRLPATLLLALCSLPLSLFAQYFSLGADPASVRWKQVKTAHFKVIYPDSMDSQALHVANALEYFRIPGSASLDVLPHKWPVILHNRAVISNAYTPYAPKRIEMVTTPPQTNQDTYAQDWLDQLVIHEFRHTVQYTSVDRGLTRGLTYLFGQQALAGVLGLFVPFWFIEGDAVITETANSHTGRGRVPSFEMKLRAQFLEKGIYSYDKAYNGSFRDFTPDHYELGYLLVGQARVEFGKETWNRVMRKTGNIPLMLVPFSNTLYKETGYGKSRLYEHIAYNLKQSWQSADKAHSLTPFLAMTGSEERYYTNRTQPAVLPDGRIVARKTSTDDVTRIVILDTAGTEKILLTPGLMIDECLSASGNLVCWAEVAKDPRWDLRSYSVIVVHDLQTGRTKKITHKTRYFSPDLSRDGRTITAVEVDERNQYFLVILDAENGRLNHRFPTPDNYFPGNPAWSPDGKQIAVILTRDEGKCLAYADTVSGEFETILPFSYIEISKPAWYGDHILFSGAYTGKDNIFAVNTDTKQLYQVTSSRFGATDAAITPDGSRLFYSDYTSGGYRVVSASYSPESWKEYSKADEPTFELAEELARQEDFIFTSEEVPDSAYKIKPYHKGLNLFNFHSWAPLSVDIDNMDFNPGISILSQNLLGTSYTTLGYAYDMNEETGKYYLKYSYEGLYPAFDLDMDYGLRRINYKDSAHGQVNYSFDEFNLSGWVRLPLNWNVRGWFLGFQPYGGYNYIFKKMNPDSKWEFKKDKFHSLNSGLFFYAQSRMSARDLNPRWGYLLEINYRHTLFESDTASSIFAAEMLLYFPGLLRHHGFRFYGGYQDRIVEYYPYSSLITYPRGYSGIYANRIFSGSVTYEFPVFCPDWKIGPVLYIKRLKAGLFYDLAIAFDSEPYQNFTSTGLDLTFDFHLFRFFAPLEAGLRSIYFPETGMFGFEFLYRLNLTGIY